MSYSVQKEENGTPAIVISGWTDGISKSPYDGVNRMLQVNLNIPGEVSVGYPITSSTVTGTLGIPIHDTTQFSFGSATANYILTTTSGAESLVFKSSTGSPTATWSALTSSNTNTGGTQNNQGLVFWNVGTSGYLFKFRNGHIDYLAGGSGSWVTNWNPADGMTTATDVIQNDTTHYALVGQDNIVYFANGRGVGSIIQLAGEEFDPTDTTTYQFTARNSAGSGSNALDIPSYDNVQSLAEQGNSLLVGGSQNAIYPWDRVSPGFSYPIFVAEGFIKRMVTANNNVYIFTGNVSSRGRIYISNGSNANLFFKIPDYLFGENDPYYEWGDAIWHRNNLIFGFFVDKNSGSGLLFSSEVWAIDLDTGAFRSISDIPANATGKANAKVLIADGSNGGTPGFSYIVGWDDGSSTPGLGYSGTTVGIGGSSITTDLIPVGTLLTRKTFSQVEFKLRSPLASGESISILWTDNEGNSGTVGTTTFAGSGAVLSDVYTASFEKSQWIQFQVVLTGNSANSGVRLREIRIR